MQHESEPQFHPETDSPAFQRLRDRKRARRRRILRVVLITVLCAALLTGAAFYVDRRIFRPYLNEPIPSQPQQDAAPSPQPETEPETPSEPQTQPDPIPERNRSLPRNRSLSSRPGRHWRSRQMRRRRSIWSCIPPPPC